MNFAANNDKYLVIHNWCKRFEHLNYDSLRKISVDHTIRLCNKNIADRTTTNST